MNDIPILLLVALAVFTVFCAWTLIDKTGNPGFLCLLFFIPVVNIVLWLYFVFAEWPVESELRRYRELYGDLTPEREVDDMSAATTCMECSGNIPAGSAVCTSCGWTYKNT